MIDVKDLMNNDTVKGLMSKFGIAEEQVETIAAEAIETVKSKFAKNPKQMSSLLSENENTDEDNAMAKEAEEDFISRIADKLGLPDNILSNLKGEMFSGLLSQVTSKLSADGKNSESGIAGMLGNITDMFDGEDKAGSATKSSGGIGGMIGKLFGK